MPKDADILAFLLHLNQSCATKEAAGEKITPPGLPLPVEEHESSSPATAYQWNCSGKPMGALATLQNREAQTGWP
jgi:hypothetical protein